MFQSDKNSGCYDNWYLPLTCNGKSWNWHLLLSHAYRNGPSVVPYLTYGFYPTRRISLVSMAIEQLNFQKHIQKSSLQKLLGGWSWRFTGMFIILASIKIVFLLLLRMFYVCHGNLKFPLTCNLGNMKNGLLLLSRCRYFQIGRSFRQKCLLSSPLPNVCFFFVQNRWILLVAMAAERLNLQNKY